MFLWAQDSERCEGRDQILFMPVGHRGLKSYCAQPPSISGPGEQSGTLGVLRKICTCESREPKGKQMVLYQFSQRCILEGGEGRERLGRSLKKLDKGLWRVKRNMGCWRESLGSQECVMCLSCLFPHRMLINFTFPLMLYGIGFAFGGEGAKTGVEENRASP